MEVIFDIFFHVFIYPVRYLIEILFYFFVIHTKTNYINTLFFVSIIINILALPIYAVADKLKAQEDIIQRKMKPEIDVIKSVYKGDKRYMLIKACHRINGYKAIYAFRSTMGLLIQIPFFFAAYNFFSTVEGFNLVSFMGITSLSNSDALIKINNININVLPFVMTLFSVFSSYMYTKIDSKKWCDDRNNKFMLKEQLSLYSMSIIFLILLYNSPAVMLLYWTINCAFSLLKNIVIYNKNKIIYLWTKLHSNKKSFNIFKLIIKLVLLIYSLVIVVMTILYIYSPMLLHKKTYFDMAIVWFLLFFIYLLKCYTKRFVHSIRILEDKKRFNLLLLSSSSLTILIGLLIPLLLIGSSPQEFAKPFYLVLINFCIYFGIFFIYPVGIYMMLSHKLKDIVVFVISLLALISIIHTFLLQGNYGTINPNFSFDFAYRLKADIQESILNIFLMVLLLVILFLIFKHKKIIFLQYAFSIISLSLTAVSIYEFVNIDREQKLLSNIAKSSEISVSEKSSIFNYSKDGENIFIIILDRGSPIYFEEAFKRMPQLKEQMEGFIFYTNTTSFTMYTFPGIQALYGGYEYTPYDIYKNNDKMGDNANTWAIHNEALLVMPKLFSDIGYSAATFAPTYANGSWVPDLSIFNKYTNIKAYNITVEIIEEGMNEIFQYNISDTENTNISTNIITDFRYKLSRFSLFRILPLPLRHDFYDGDGWYIATGENLVVSKISSMHTYALMLSLKSMTDTKKEGNNFNMMHSDITHDPDNFNSDYRSSSVISDVPKDDLDYFLTEFSARSYYAHVASLETLVNYFNFLKENDVYDNTKIIIVSDHGREGFLTVENNTEELWNYRAFASLLLVKDFNSKHPLGNSSNFMTIADVPFIATSHLEEPANPFTGNVFTNNYKDNGIKVFTSEIFQFTHKYDVGNVYNVKDNIYDTNNWFKIDE